MSPGEQVFPSTQRGLPALERWSGRGIEVAFSGRAGGVSRGPWRGCNVGDACGDDPDSVGANRRLIAAATHVDPATIHSARQVHGTTVCRVGGVATEPTTATWDRIPNQSEGDPVNADALLANRGSGVALAVVVADCLPVALVGDTTYAGVHAGWRGLKGGIIESCVEQMMPGATPDSRRGWHAVIGPHIGPCCYTVSRELASDFGVDGRQLDLAREAIVQLERHGIRKVSQIGSCTACHPDTWYSYRASSDGVTGRQAVIAWEPDSDGGA